MLIVIKDPEGKQNLRFRLPSSILFSPLGARFLSRLIGDRLRKQTGAARERGVKTAGSQDAEWTGTAAQREYVKAEGFSGETAEAGATERRNRSGRTCEPMISPATLNLLLRSLKEMKKTFPETPLVEVKTAQGQEIYIRL